MRVLITNLYISNYSGSENVVEMLAEGLRKAGHQPTIFAPSVGPQGANMRMRGFEVVDRISQLTKVPEVIHGQHLSPTLIAMSRFPDVPVVFTCHSSIYEVEAPLPHPQIRKVIAVDEACAAKCRQRGVRSKHLSIILNAVDMGRFKRRISLPMRPRRALLLTKNREHIAATRLACTAAGIELDEMGPGTGKFVPEIETVLGDYDLVFATARMALEAAATGCATIVCDARGFAGMLTTQNLPAWRPMNFGISILNKPASEENLREAIAQYDATDAALVTDELRRSAGADKFVRRYLNVYRRAIGGPAPSRADINLATAHWVEELAVTRAERKWRRIVKELSLTEIPTAGWNPETLASLQGKLADVSTRLDAALAERASVDAMFAAISARLHVTPADIGVRLNATLTQGNMSLDAKLAEISAKLDARSNVFWKLLRRLCPPSVRKFLRKKLRL